MSNTSGRIQNIKTNKDNRIIHLVAHYYGFDKNGVIAYYNRKEPILPMPHPYCFDNSGKMYYIPPCYSELPVYVKEKVIKGNPTRSPLVEVFSQDNKKKKTYYRQTMGEYLKKNEVLLLDNSVLTTKRLPYSKYYIFVDWVWLSNGACKEVKQLDSICAAHKDLITLIKVHAYSPKFIDVKVPDHLPDSIEKIF